MKKYLAYALMIICAAIMVRLLVHIDENDSNDIITAFESKNYVESEASLESFFYYGDIYLTQGDRKELLEKIAREIGIRNKCDYKTERTDDGYTSTIMYKYKGGELKCTLTTVESQIDKKISYLSHYITVNMTFENAPESAWYYKDRVRKVLEGLPYTSITPEVTMNLVGKMSGCLSGESCRKMSDTLMKQLGADVLEIKASHPMPCSYGYTERIPEYAMIGGKRVNVNIAFSYDEKKDSTIIYMSTPIINLDF